MGACLSKTGKKGREGEDQDKMPYTKTPTKDEGKKNKKKQKGGQSPEPAQPDPVEDAVPAEVEAATTGDQPQGQPKVGLFLPPTLFVKCRVVR